MPTGMLEHDEPPDKFNSCDKIVESEETGHGVQSANVFLYYDLISTRDGSRRSRNK